MSLPDQAGLEKTERLQLLKQRAQAILSKNSEVQAEVYGEQLQMTKLLEDLRIYQVELELQNEELRAAQLEADLARKRYQLCSTKCRCRRWWWTLMDGWTIPMSAPVICWVR